MTVPRGLFAVAVAALLISPAARAQSDVELQTAKPMTLSAVPETVPGAPAASTTLSMVVGEIRTISSEAIDRIALGNPSVADVSVLSPAEVLIQAVAAGSTDLIVWDAKGRQSYQIQVSDPSARNLEENVRRLVTELGLPVQVVREESKVFIIGEVERVEDLDRLEQMLSAYRDVTNLVKVRDAQVADGQQLVKLGVQVVEMSRADFEALGVDWSDSLDVLEGTEGLVNVSPRDLFRVGQATTRDGIEGTIHALIRERRARLLAEPKLVTASGKQASSFIGVEVPTIKGARDDSDGITFEIDFRKTGVLLTMTPVVSPDKTRITTTLEAEVSDIDEESGLDLDLGGQSVNIPGFAVRKMNTEVTGAPGETIVIGGLVEAEDVMLTEKVPGLSSIPGLGRLFRSPSTDSTQREVVVVVTPELILDAATEVDKSLALEQALAVAEVTASVDDPKLRYALGVQERIAQAIHYPQREKELAMGGTVKLKLHLFADGTLGRAVVSQSSGISALDAEALKAAETQAPYPGFPSELSEREMWIEIPVIFKP